MAKGVLNSNSTTSALHLLIICILLTATLAEKVKPKIIIIGAGAAGIASAVKLLEYGFEDIIILEAEPRIGGRIYTIPYGENVIDLGAQWCHRGKGNLVYDLAVKHDLLEPFNETERDILYARSNGEKLDESIAKKLRTLAAYVKERRAKEINEHPDSVGSYMWKVFNDALRFSAYKSIPFDLATEFYHIFEKSESFKEGSDDLNDISARDYKSLNEIENDDFLNWKTKGYKEFLQLLMRTNETGKEFGILDGLIKLSKRVSRIYWQNKNYKTVVKCMDGAEFEADHVIVSLSLGVLKAHLNDMFEPSLPEEKQKAIKSIAYGSCNNIYLEFSKQFWNASWGGFNFLWRDEDLKELRSSNRSWLEGVYGFNTVPYQPYVLQGHVIGATAREIESLPSEQLEAGIVYLLEKFMDMDIPMPINITMSNWFRNPNFRGCYSYHSVATERADVSNQHIANALKAICDLDNYVDLCEKPVLQFAGEATDSLHYATVDGAVESGYREAQRIRDYYALGPQQSGENIKS